MFISDNVACPIHCFHLLDQRYFLTNHLRGKLNSSFSPASLLFQIFFFVLLQYPKPQVPEKIASAVLHQRRDRGVPSPLKAYTHSQRLL